MPQPEIMVPPLLWLVSAAAAGVTAKRFIAADWDRSLPPAQAAEKAGAPRGRPTKASVKRSKPDPRGPRGGVPGRPAESADGAVQ